MIWQRTVAVAFSLSLFALFAVPVQAAGVVNECSEAGLLTALSGGGTVSFACSGTILLTAPIAVTANTTIDGTGQTVVISGGGSVEIFSVSVGVSLTLNQLELASGNTGLFGGAINNQGTLIVSDSKFIGNSAGFLGGAIFNLGSLTVMTTTFADNTASASGGGAILNDGVANISDSTFSSNNANSGGAIDNSFGTLTVVNCTLWGNGASDIGGAILNDDSTTVINCTIADNDASLGGGVDDNFGTLTLENSIVAYNESGNCAGDVSGAGNLSTDDSCPGIQNTNPLLGPLQFNGGPTETMALLAGSPALDAAIESYCPATDQRGVPRPQGPRCDIGAYERASVPAYGWACTTYYNGVFQGTVIVFPGQTCGFVSGGGVTGSILVFGGNLVLSNATIGGDVLILAGTAFIASGSQIEGNLDIQDLVPANSAQNEVCGSNVGGNVEIDHNQAIVTVGSSTAALSCPGNNFEGDVKVDFNNAETVFEDNQIFGSMQVDHNWGLTKIIDNFVKNNLSCENNADIIGGPNKAPRIQGQCF